MLWPLVFFMVSTTALLVALSSSPPDSRKNAPSRHGIKRGTVAAVQENRSGFWLLIITGAISLLLGVLSLFGDFDVIGTLITHLVWNIVIVILTGGTILLLYALLMLVSMRLLARLDATAGRKRKPKRKRKNDEIVREHDQVA